MRISKAMTAVIAVVALIIAVVISSVVYVNSVRNEGIGFENNLEAQYKTNQSTLSTHILVITESLGVADKGSTKLQEILTEAVKGRYDGKMAPGTGGEMFSAITEAYPDLTATSESYAKVQDQVMAGRTAYKNEQKKLDHMISSYENWSQQGLIKSNVVKMMGFPSDTLEARIGDRVYKGADALDYMKRLVLVEEAVTSYETGVMEPLITPEGE